MQISLKSVQSGPRIEQVDLRACRRILIVKLDYLGDWVLCTPFLENLRRNAPDAVIEAVVLDRVFALASMCPFLDRATPVASDLNGADPGVSRWRDTAGLRPRHGLPAFDLAIVPRWDVDFSAAARLAAASSAPLILGFSEQCTRRKRVINAGDDQLYTHVVVDRRPVHEVEHTLALIEALNGRIVARQTSVHITDADIRAAAEFLMHTYHGNSRPILALAPFASEPKRSVPLTWMTELARRIADVFGCAMVVIGGPTDRLRAERLARTIGPCATAAAGRLSLREACALIGRCNALLGMDSAPAHIASAAGIPAVVLSCHPCDGSPHHPNAPNRFGPWCSRSSLVVRPSSARPPCRRCCQASDPHCILEIGEQQKDDILAFIGEAFVRAGGEVPDSRLLCIPEKT